LLIFKKTKNIFRENLFSQFFFFKQQDHHIHQVSVENISPTTPATVAGNWAAIAIAQAYVTPY
jgi:hypothetical protein